MNTFNNLRIGVRLGIGFALMIASILGVAIYARVALHAHRADGVDESLIHALER